MTLLELLLQELPKRGGWPEGAERARQDNDREICFEGVGGVYDFVADEMSDDSLRWLNENDRNTSELYVTREQYEATGWDGTGLPPVGVECEYMKHTRSTGNNWSKGTVKYISEYTVVIDDDDVDGEFIAHPLNCAFRFGAEWAERAIDEMVRLSGVSIGAAKILYDAGYRK